MRRLSVSRDLLGRFRAEPDATLLPVSEIVVTHIKTLANSAVPAAEAAQEWSCPH
jgi:hypothetical protein